MKRCSDCGAITKRSSKRCLACKDKENARQRKQYQERLVQGLCPRCGSAPVPGSNHCKLCSNRTAQRDKRRAKDRLAKGICPQCGQRPCELNRRRCSVCAIKNCHKVIARQTRLAKRGLCTRCGKYQFLPSMKDKISKYRECMTCYLKRTAKSNLGSEDFADLLLAKLEEQSWICPYTGEILVLGDNDSVDHIQPRKRFPDQAINSDNVEWITRRANIMKSDLLPDEFLTLVKQVHDYRCL